MASFVQNIGYAAGLAEGVSVIAGIGLILGGIFALKRYGEQRSMMGQQHTLGKPLLLIICGSVLLLLPEMIPVFVSSIFVNLQDDSAGQNWHMQGLYMFIRFLGLCSVIRGIIMLSKTGGQGGQPGARGKAFVHIFGGILLLHVETVKDLLTSFFSGM
jgi:intracellular multiplication protein IcmC